MADNSIKILIEAQNKATKELNQVKKELESLKKATKDTGTEGGKSVGGLLDQFKALKMGAVPYLAAAGSAVTAFKKTIEFSREGAMLEFTGEKFERLAETVGSTKDAMLRDLREASKGTISDMELMASATDFMALGLAKSHDEVVRLTNVASALGMNMNQLVLTLTNQTTMRFDALGVSVDGFKEKVKELEDAGMSADEAFKEAFLQQAEEQIQRVGNAADAAIGDFKRLESAIKNFGDAAKIALSDKLAPAVEETADMFSVWAKRMQDNQSFDNLAEQLEAAGGNVDLFNDKFKDTKNFAGWIEDVEGFEKLLLEMAIAIEVANDKTGRAVDMTAEKMIAAAIAGDKFGKSLSRISATGKGMGIALGGISDAIANITSVSSNFGNIVGFAESYDDLLGELNETESKMAELQEIANAPQPTGGYFDGMYYSIQDARRELELLGDGTDETKEKIKRLQQISQLEAGGMFEGVWMSAREAKGAVEELTGEAERLKGEMESLANQMVLNMFAATIAIGGVNEAELTAYMEMAVRMGEISQEAADTAIDEFQRAVDFINKYEIQDRYFRIFGEVIWPAMSGSGGTSFGGGGGGGFGRVVGRNEAAGGIVHAAAGAFGKQAYYVGEIGPEIFVPSQDGRILSNHESKAAIRSGFGSMNEQPIVININTPINLADRVWVENELAPYIRDAIQKQAIRG